LGDVVIAAVPALAESGMVYRQDGSGYRIQPVGSYYVLALEPASCPEGFGCFIGGEPLVLVEDAPDAPTREIVALTRTTLVRGGIGAGVVVIAAAAVWIVWRRRRN
jgi:hypothetical protein